MVAKKIRDMKGNKSSGVDWIPPQITIGNCRTNSVLLATVFSLSLKEGIVPLDGKKQTPFHYLKQVRETSQRTIDQ